MAITRYYPEDFQENKNLSKYYDKNNIAPVTPKEVSAALTSNELIDEEKGTHGDAIIKMLLSKEGVQSRDVKSENALDYAITYANPKLINKVLSALSKAEKLRSYKR